MAQACSASVRTRREAMSGRVIGALYEAEGAGSTRPPSPRRLGHRRSPDQRHESHVHELLRLDRTGPPPVAHQALDPAAAADRHHHPATFAKLLEQGCRRLRGGGGDDDRLERGLLGPARSEEHTAELQSLMRTSYA